MTNMLMIHWKHWMWEHKSFYCGGASLKSNQTNPTAHFSRSHRMCSRFVATLIHSLGRMWRAMLFPRCLFAQCWVKQSAFKATNNCDRDSNATRRADAGKCVMARVPLRLKEGLPHWRGGDSLNKTPHAQFPLPRTHTRHRTRSELRGCGSPACCVTAVLTSSLLCLSLGRL